MWSDELAKAVKLWQAARKTLTREPTARNRKRYNALCRRAKGLGQEARKTAWHSTCESLNLKTAPKAGWALVLRMSNKRGPKRVEPLINKGRTLDSPRKEAEALNIYYSKVAKGRATASDPTVDKARRKWQRKPTACPRTFTAAFTITELDNAVEKMRTGKAPGQDGISPEMIKNLGAFAKQKLLRLFNNSWERGEIHKVWKTAVIVPILKKRQARQRLGKLPPNLANKRS